MRIRTQRTWSYCTRKYTYVYCNDRWAWSNTTDSGIRMLDSDLSLQEEVVFEPSTIVNVVPKGLRKPTSCANALIIGVISRGVRIYPCLIRKIGRWRYARKQRANIRQELAVRKRCSLIRTPTRKRWSREKCRRFLQCWDVVPVEEVMQGRDIWV